MPNRAIKYQRSHHICIEKGVLAHLILVLAPFIRSSYHDTHKEWHSTDHTRVDKNNSQVKKGFVFQQVTRDSVLLFPHSTSNIGMSILNISEQSFKQRRQHERPPFSRPQGHSREH